VIATTEQAGNGIRIELDTGVLVIHPSIDEVYVEIAQITGWSDSAWMVWFPGEGCFDYLR
jgi:hypothetical protein